MMEKVLFELRPQIAVAIIPTIFWSIIVAGFAGFLTFSFAKSIVVFSVVFLLVFIVMTLLTFMNIKSRRYIFYSDKAEFYEGFLNIVQRTVRYTKITDCVLRKSVWDRLFGTGTVRLITAGHEGGGGYGYAAATGGGISIQYVENPDQVYKKIEHLLQKH